MTPEQMLDLVRMQLTNRPNAQAAADQPAPMSVLPDEIVNAASTNPPPIPDAERAIAPAPPPAVGTPASMSPAAMVANLPDPSAFPPPEPEPDPAANTIAVQQPAVRQVQEFYAPLAPYGSWVDLPAYGRVWQPAVTVIDLGWRPYCHNGRWIFTDCGWHWHSGYSWGWAPFHYGRWCYVNRYRWVWVPDTVWAPAWVSWRRTDTHCGWAPLPPGARFRIGFGFMVENDDTVFDVQFGLTAQHYVFIENSRFGDRDLVRVFLRGPDRDLVFRNSSHVRNSHVWNDQDRRIHNFGPGREWAERATKRPLRPVQVVTAPPFTPPHPPRPRTEIEKPAIPPKPPLPPVRGGKIPVTREIPETRRPRTLPVEQDTPPATLPAQPIPKRRVTPITPIAPPVNPTPPAAVHPVDSSGTPPLVHGGKIPVTREIPETRRPRTLPVEQDTPPATLPAQPIPKRRVTPITPIAPPVNPTPPAAVHPVDSSDNTPPARRRHTDEPPVPRARTPDTAPAVVPPPPGPAVDRTPERTIVRPGAETATRTKTDDTSTKTDDDTTEPTRWRRGNR
jgi:hypothetical protein